MKRHKSQLLLDSQPLIILPELAMVVGLNEAIILQQIHYWTEINRKARKNKRQGHYWTYNTFKEWQEQFPFWSIPTIKRSIKKLECEKLLLSDHFNKMKLDRTKWYRIDYDVLMQQTGRVVFLDDYTEDSQGKEEARKEAIWQADKSMAERDIAEARH
jgi:hypothetical protein